MHKASKHSHQNEKSFRQSELEDYAVLMDIEQKGFTEDPQQTTNNTHCTHKFSS